VKILRSCIEIPIQTHRRNKKPTSQKVSLQNVGLRSQWQQPLIFPALLSAFLPKPIRGGSNRMGDNHGLAAFDRDFTGILINPRTSTIYERKSTSNPNMNKNISQVWTFASDSNPNVNYQSNTRDESRRCDRDASWSSRKGSYR
jgi:hypothetical protein